MSHNSLFLFFRLFVRVLLHGLWQKDTKSAGHWYMVVFLAEGARNENIQIVIHLIEFHKNRSYRTNKTLLWMCFPVNVNLDGALSLQFKCI